MNSFISYYEPAYYNTSQVADQLLTGRTKRSADHHHSNNININFKAHER